MEEHNLDFEIPLSREQWDQLGRTAARLGPDDGGFDWRERERDRIHVFMRYEEAHGAWCDFLNERGRYGDSEMEVARFVFNDGRPYAELDSPPQLEQPTVPEPQEREMEVGLEHFVREKWDALMRESGLHYTPAKLDYDRPPPL